MVEEQPEQERALRAVEDPVEVIEGEIVEGPWTVFISEQKDLGSVDTLSLATELFDRVRRSRPSPARDQQMRMLNTLVGDLLHDDSSQRALPSGTDGV